MKYIRTKDDVLLRDINNDKYYAWLQTEPTIHDIISEADAIEELCDEAVFFDKDNVPHYKSKEGNIWYLGAGLFTESLRFGIFTGKGLIYVAKMNEKGELELL